MAFVRLNKRHVMLYVMLCATFSDCCENRLGGFA